MNDAPQHTFQLLTKRPERLAQIADQLDWAPNIWQGVTVESEKYVDRITLLRSTPAQTKFISFEPLLSDVGHINLSSIDWAIVGGESGPRSCPIELDWVLNIKDQCEKQEVLFYFKQWGGVNKKKSGRDLLERTWNNILIDGHHRYEICTKHGIPFTVATMIGTWSYSKGIYRFSQTLYDDLMATPLPR